MIKKLLKLVKKTLKKIIYPIIYSYPGYLLYDFIHRLSGYKKERSLVYKAIGYYPNLKNPQSYNEKILWKKVYDRNPLLPIISDKYKVRHYLKEVLGKKEAEKILVPLLHVTDNPDTIPFDDIIGEYVIKPNHASGKIILIEDIKKRKKFTVVDDNSTSIFWSNNQARKKIKSICKGWLSTPYGFHNHEWAYQKIKRKIIIEKLLRDSSGKIPTDYNFNIFHGDCYSITVWYDRFIDLRMGRYTPDWEYIDVPANAPQAEYRQKPKNLQFMIYLAKILGKPFDFVRVDLYLLDNQIYFGELTNYTVSGKVPFKPVSYDFMLGSNWKIIPKYWQLQ